MISATNTLIHIQELVHQIIEQTLESVAVKGVDYYRVDREERGPHTAVLYSKHYSGGGYQCVFRYFGKNDTLTIRPLLFGAPFGWKYAEDLNINLGDPDSFDLIASAIRQIFDSNQKDRTK